MRAGHQAVLADAAADSGSQRPYAWCSGAHFLPPSALPAAVGGFQRREAPSKERA